MIQHVLVIAILGIAPQDERLEKSLLIVPNETTQRKIDDAINTLLDAKSSPESLAAVGKLEELSDELGDEMFFQQLFYHFVQQNTPSDPRAEVRLPAMLTSLVICGVSPTVVTRTVHPYLDGEQARLRKIAQDFLVRYVENHYRDAEPNFASYARIITPVNMPPALVDHMFRQSPDTAMKVIARAHSSDRDLYREVVLAQHAVGDAIWALEHGFGAEFAESKLAATRNLAHLSKHPQWWARLYAANILCRFRELREEETVERLRNDKEAIVRRAIDPTRK